MMAEVRPQVMLPSFLPCPHSQTIQQIVETEIVVNIILLVGGTGILSVTEATNCARHKDPPLPNDALFAYTIENRLGDPYRVDRAAPHQSKWEYHAQARTRPNGRHPQSSSFHSPFVFGVRPRHLLHGGV